MTVAIYRPDTEVSTALTPSTGTDNAALTSDESNTTYVYATNVSQTDRYTASSDAGVTAGATITKVELKGNMTVTDAMDGYAGLYAWIGETAYYGDTRGAMGFETKVFDLTELRSWAAGDFEDLNLGIFGYTFDVQDEAMVSEVWLEVTYTPAASSFTPKTILF